MREKVKQVLLKHLKGKNAESRIETCLNELMPVIEGTKPVNTKQAFGVVMTHKAAETKIGNNGEETYMGRPSVV